MFVKPNFFDSFRCKASECTDSCCVGWEIDIDSETLEKYNNADGEFGERLRNNISSDGDCTFFSLAANERCPFLNNKNLCDIYINMGEESLCNICREHPRFYNEFAGRCEAGLGLCCEKVCEIIFGNDAPLELVVEDDGYDDDFDAQEEAVVSLRKRLFDIVCDRNLSIPDRIKMLCGFDMKNANLMSIISLFAKTEPINAEWSEYISKLNSGSAKLADVTPQFSESDYEKLLCYLIYRYFINSFYDGDTDGWILFCVINVLFVYAMDLHTLYMKGKYDLSDRIENVKLWSKQIEYSQENIDFIKESVSELF